MSRLRLRWTDESMPSAPDPCDPSIEVWRDLDGRIGALGERLASHLRLHLPGLATFEFQSTSDDVVVRVAARARRDLVEDQFLRTALPLILQARGREVLHASAVRTPSGVVALCAEKESGKSTLAYALAHRGTPIWADDAVSIDLDEERAWSEALPFALRLRPASTTFFERSQATLAGVATAGSGGERAPLRAIFVLSRAREADLVPAKIEARRLEASEAFTALLANAYCFSLRDVDRKQAMMSHYLALTRRVPTFALRYPTGLEHLEVILDAIESALRTTSETSPATD